MSKSKKDLSDAFFEQQCDHLRNRALNKTSWGQLLLVNIDKDIHRRLALYASDYGLAPTPFVTEIVTEWVLKMDKKALPK